MRPGRALALLALLLTGLGLGACRRDAQGFDAEPIESGPPVPYRVEFAGSLPPEAARLLPEVSEARRRMDRPPTSELVIRARAQGDVPRLDAALRSLGYYEARIEPEVEGFDARAGAADPSTVLVRFQVEAGPLYRFGRLDLELTGGARGFVPPTFASLGLRPGEPAKAQPVLDAEGSLLEKARKAGHALAKPGPRATVIDPQTQAMDVTLRLDPGPVASFGPVSLSGFEGIDEGFLRRRLGFKEGERFDPDRLEAGRRGLIDTNLFATVIVKEGEALLPGGGLPIGIELTRRAPRSVGAGLGYETDLGPTARFFWEHRNFLGAGERLRSELDLAQDRQLATAELRKPDFLSPGQALVGNTELRNEETDAYKTQSAGASVAIERPLAKGVTGSLGLAYRYALIDDLEDEEDAQPFALLSLPGRLDWDFSDSLLDPTKGGRVNLLAAPYVDTLEPSTQFLKLRLTHSRYLKLLDDPRLILAGRVSVGSIIGVDTGELPADERFYAGGGGSVRGVGYQLAGPLSDHDKPLGGTSLIELGAELRYKITPSIGLVLFLDAGTVADTVYPDPTGDLSFGAGPGLRYYTPIGPLRLDLGFPLNPRQGVDDLFQLYISIGQAF